MALPCKNLNLNLYRVFYTVAKTKSFSESSRVLHISQPAISKHIQNLEYELNTLLFYRTNRGIELTPEARNLLVYVERAYNFLMLGEKELQESKELIRGKVSVGVPTFIGVNFLNDPVKEFMKEHPNIIVKMASHSNSTLLDMLAQHTLDILVIPDLDVVPKDVKVVELRKEKYCFAYSSKYSLKKDITRLNDLIDEKLLLPVKKTVARKNLDDVFNRKGLVADPIMELGSNEIMLNYIKEGMGIGYILESVAKSNDDFNIITLEESLPLETISLVYNQSTLTNSTKEFINLLLDEKKKK